MVSDISNDLTCLFNFIYCYYFDFRHASYCAISVSIRAISVSIPVTFPVDTVLISLSVLFKYCLSSGAMPCFEEQRKEIFIKNLEAALDSVGDDSQLANVDLQTTMQTAQQNIQQLSNISKMLSDTAMNTIRKINGG